MQVLCKASNTGSDMRCPVCGQGFLVYWTRNAPEERAYRREEVLLTLRGHHADDQTKHAHPQAGFHLPAWKAEPAVSAAAALLSDAPILAAA